MTLKNLTGKIDSVSLKYKKKGRKNIVLRRVIVIAAIFLIFLLTPSFFVYNGFQATVSSAKALINAYNLQNYDTLKKEIGNTKSSLQRTNIAVSLLFWMRIIPFFGGYYSDLKKFTQAGVEGLIATETILKDLEREKEYLGFDGNRKSGPDRMTQVIKILNKSQGSFDKIDDNLKKAANYVKEINTAKYPITIRGKELRKNLEVLKSFIIGAEVALSKGRDALTLAPSSLGLEGQKTYLLLFQNDKEIRPTGGFLTAFATLTLTNGQVSSSTSDDIYRLDEKLLNVCLTKICPLTPPEPIVRYLPETTGKPRSAWSMRDSNMSPDLPTSAREFIRMYELLGEGFPYDGIIFIDSQVVEELIEVTGPINVFDIEYSSKIDPRCNCSNVIYELESYAEIASKGEKDRKAILGVLMQQILAKTMGADVDKIPQFVETVARLANHKHIMFFTDNQKLQDALSKLNWTGEIRGAYGIQNFDGDYLHINDSNFAGGKSNLYVEQTVTQEINTQKDGAIKKKITVEYKNPQKFNTWLNGINRDYVRFYVPKGSKLVSSKGSEVTVTTIEDELGKTVFEAFIQVRPENSRKLEIEFTSPYDAKDEYKLLVQKQPGAKDFKYKIKLNGKNVADFELDQDKEFKFDL